MDYYFVNNEEMEKVIKNSPVWDSSHRNVSYATSLDEFTKSNNVYRELSIKGINDLRTTFGRDNVKIIYIYANPDDCYERLIKRDGKEQATIRMLCNYSENSFNNFNIADFVIINSDIELAKDSLRFYIRRILNKEELYLKYINHIHKCIQNKFLSKFYIDKTGLLTKEEVEELKILFGGS